MICTPLFVPTLNPGFPLSVSVPDMESPAFNTFVLSVAVPAVVAYVALEAVVALPAVSAIEA